MNVRVTNAPPLFPSPTSAFYNNTLVMTGTNVGSFTCSGAGKTIVHDSHIYTASGTATGSGQTFESGSPRAGSG